MKIETLIFDLDGTLIDSAPAILASFAHVLQMHGMEPVQPLTGELIGPPLQQTLAKISGSQDPALLNVLTSAFKAHYDSRGYLNTPAFDGVDAMLKRLTQQSIPLYIATNKRATPTALIIDLLGWRDYFQGVFALDSITPAAPNKGHLLRHIISSLQLNVQNTLYVGDRSDDRRAAQEAGLAYFHANWGYEPEPSPTAVPGIAIAAFCEKVLSTPRS